MELIEAQIDSVVALGINGRIDSVTAGTLKDRLAGLVQSGKAHLVVDFKDVAYISSAGFRTLLIAAKMAEEAGGRIALCGINGEVRRLFEIAAFTELFLILSDRNEAAAAVKRPA
ncbi:MAG TPA: STAS domain-containing protein [Burkholderiales bacterium]|nr:STAS domain-containing protein [Burkholderiales bacterium]